MLLHYQNHENETSHQIPLVFIHGLFGSLSNLGMLARTFMSTHSVIQIDVRNHGLSEHSDIHDYTAMANDVLETLDHLNINEFSVIGHSMGGKIAFKLTDLAKDRVKQAVILDISPRPNTANHHKEIFEALFAVENAQVQSRTDATNIMREHLNEEMVIQFLLKSFQKGQWLFNVQSLYDNYSNILDWEYLETSPLEILIIRGAESDYIQSSEDYVAIEQQFPNAKIVTVPEAGHWLHAQKTQDVLDYMTAYIKV